jgi:hypothetical protein
MRVAQEQSGRINVALLSNLKLHVMKRERERERERESCRRLTAVSSQLSVKLELTKPTREFFHCYLEANSSLRRYDGIPNSFGIFKKKIQCI